MFKNNIYTNSSLPGTDIANPEGGDIINTIQKLIYISRDIQMSYNINNLHSRIKTLYSDEIKQILFHLDLIKVSIDINYKFSEMPIPIRIYRQKLITLILDIQDLLISVINKNDTLIRKYSSYIAATVTAMSL